jgi:hypothetical protein
VTSVLRDAGSLPSAVNCRFLNIITELIAGYAWPGNAIANMCVKMYGYNSVKHGMDFAQDLKLGQYMVRVLAVFVLSSC